MRRVRIVVTGMVQGVGFRFSTKAEADRIGVTGWVRNVDSDRVEIEAQGEAEAVDRLIAWARRGPAYADVAGVDIVDVDVVEGESGVEVRATR